MDDMGKKMSPLFVLVYLFLVLNGEGIMANVEAKSNVHNIQPISSNNLFFLILLVLRIP